jgi:hypothetical protein
MRTGVYTILLTLPDRDVIQQNPGHLQRPASQVMRAMLAWPQVPLYHFLSADYAITDAFIAG